MTGDRTSYFARIYIHLYPGGLSLHYTPINASVLRHWNTSAAQADLAWRREKQEPPGTCRSPPPTEPPLVSGYIWEGYLRPNYPFWLYPPSQNVRRATWMRCSRWSGSVRNSPPQTSTFALFGGRVEA